MAAGAVFALAGPGLPWGVLAALAAWGALSIWTSPDAEARSSLGSSVLVAAAIALAVAWLQNATDERIRADQVRRDAQQRQADKKRDDDLRRREQQARADAEQQSLLLTIGLRRDLRRIDLQGRDLREAYFARKDLREANLSGSDLRGTSLTDANFRGAKLYYANLENADASPQDRLVGDVWYQSETPGTDLRRADMAGANLTLGKFDFAQMHEAVLSSAYLCNASFNLTDMSTVAATDALFIGAQLINTFLNGADLRDSDFRYADLSAADLRGAKLGGAKFDATTTYDRSTRFPKGFNPKKRGLTLDESFSGTAPAPAPCPRWDPTKVVLVGPFPSNRSPQTRRGLSPVP